MLYFYVPSAFFKKYKNIKDWRIRPPQLTNRDWLIIMLKVSWQKAGKDGQAHCWKKAGKLAHCLKKREKLGRRKDDIPHFSSWMTKRFIIYVFWFLTVQLTSSCPWHWFPRAFHIVSSQQVQENQEYCQLFWLAQIASLFFCYCISAFLHCVTSPTSLLSGLVLIINI